MEFSSRKFQISGFLSRESEIFRSGDFPGNRDFYPGNRKFSDQLISREIGDFSDLGIFITGIYAKSPEFTSRRPAIFRGP